MSTLVRNGDAHAALGPAVHLEFIQNQLGRPDEEAAEDVASYHRALFLHHHGAELEKQRQQAQIHEERLAHLDERLRSARGRLADQQKVIPAMINGEADVKPSLPWNAWDATMFWLAALGVLALVVFGVLNVSLNLLESGLVTFVESPLRAYLWAALLPVGAFAVKTGWDILEGSKAKTAYVWSCLVIGLVGAMVWVAAYAAVYPSLTKSVAEHVQTLSVFDGAATDGAVISGAGAKWVDIITVAAQCVAEIFLSALLGIYMTMIYARHRPVRLAANPLFTQLEEDRRALEAEVAAERLALAEARGAQSRLENQLNALLAYAKSLFLKEAALLRDQAHQRQSLLEDLSKTLRSQLDQISNGAGVRNRALENHAENGQ